MKRLYLSLILVFFITAAQAGEPAYLGYNNGQNYVKLFSDNERATYAQGFINAITVHELFENKDNYHAFMQCTQAMTAGRIGEVIKRYIMDNPDKANISLNILSVYALNEACSEKKK